MGHYPSLAAIVLLMAVAVVILIKLGGTYGEFRRAGYPPRVQASLLAHIVGGSLFLAMIAFLLVRG